MSKTKPGKYWDDTLNMARHIDCHCETGDKCWWKQMHKRFQQPLGWFPEQANKVSTTGKAKVYAVQWLGDIAFLERVKIATIVTSCHRINTERHYLRLPLHTFLFLTKFPEKLNIMSFKYAIKPEDNLWLGISASDQYTFDKRIAGLLKFDGFKKWVSLEPLYGGIDLKTDLAYKTENGYTPLSGFINQVIIGGMTNAPYKANLDWFRSIRDQCKAAGVPFFIKHIDEHGRMLDGQFYDNLQWYIS